MALIPPGNPQRGHDATRLVALNLTGRKKEEKETMEHSYSSLSTPRQYATRPRSAKTLLGVLYYVVCGAIALLCLAPLLWSTVTAFKPLRDTLANPLNLLPAHLTLNNFLTLTTSGSGLTTYIVNSIVVALGTVAG